MQKSLSKTFCHLLLMAFCGVVLFALPGCADEFRQTSHYKRRLFSSATFTMEVRTGDIYITGWDDPHVEIEAEKVVHANSKDEAERQYQHVRELDAAREVSRLELKLAQENLQIIQASFQEGRANLRDVERARLDENEKWVAFLDSDYERRKAQLELLNTTGDLDKLFR